MFSWWTFNDIFEEGGQESEVFNKSDGWGLISLYNIYKPSFRAFELLHQTGTKRIPGVPAPDFYVTLGAVATSNATHVTILIWNHDVPTAHLLTETTCVLVTGYKKGFQLPASVRRIDENHANTIAEWKTLGSPKYLNAKQIQQLQIASEMVPENITYTISDQGELTFQIDIPPQGVAAIVVPLPN